MVSGRSVTECWRLRPVSQSDIAGLHALACQPLIYRYLFDNVATRMAWTAITRAFASPHIDYIVAGHDLPNTASSAVMRRLGMRFTRMSDTRWGLEQNISCTGMTPDQCRALR